MVITFGPGENVRWEAAMPAGKSSPIVTGILTTLDPATGNVLKRERLQGAIDAYYTSLVAGDGKFYGRARFPFSAPPPSGPF